MTTLGQVIDNARVYLNDQYPGINTVTTHTPPTVTFTYDLGSIAAGTRFSSGLQTFYVQSVTTPSRQAQVTVVQGDTTTPLSVGANVIANPRYTGFELLMAVNHVLKSLSSPMAGLFQVKAVEAQYSSDRDGYDLSGATDIQQIYEVLMQQPGPYKDWPRMHTGNWRLNRSADPTDFTSGQSLTLFQNLHNGYNLRVVYKAAFGQFTSLTDTLTTVGISETCDDILSLGAAVRLMSGAEVARNNTAKQGDTRRMAEVPAGAVQNSVQGLRAEYLSRVAEEAARLAHFYPAYRG